MTAPSIGIVGSGVMGAGIAQTALAAGFSVILCDVNAAALGKAKTDIFSRLSRSIEKGQLPPGFLADAERRLTLAGSLTAIAPAEIVIEAIIEQLGPKQALFRDLERVVSPNTLLATNTSSLSVAAIASGCARQERICGLHFFNPVPVMRLVEVIAAPNTSHEAAERAYALAVAMGKTAVRVKDGPGFLVNLGGRAYVTEGLHIVQEGVVDFATLDRIMRDAVGFRMGPFELMDLTGIDVNFAVASFIYAGYQHDPRLRTTSLHELMFNSGRFGRKSGQGFYSYGADTGKQAKPERISVRGRASFRAALPDVCPALEAFGRTNGLVVTPDAEISLIAPLGEDAASVAARLQIDPTKLVAIDLSTIDRDFVTLMAPLGHGGAPIAEVTQWLSKCGLQVETIKDSPGFIAPRMLAMIANLGCEMAQIGVGTPKDIDTAMKLGLNYPRGPLEFAEWLGLGNTHAILQGIQEVTGSDRYRPSLWLRRRALLGRSVYERD